MTKRKDISAKSQLSLDVRPRAEADIENILLYTTHRWGRTQRSRYRRVLNRAIQEISAYPEIGKDRDDLAQGVRSLAVGEHIVFYRLTDDRIVVLRVLHARQEAAAELR